jgi:hypothetical protein
MLSAIIKGHLMKASRDERGVATVLLVILVAAVLAVVGLAVYNARQSKSQTAATGPSSSPAQSPETSATPAATTAYLHIKEMGIKLPLSADITDLTYYYNATSKTAELSSKSLADKTGGACAAASGVGPLETLHRTTELPSGYDSRDTKQVNGYYIWRTPPQAACSTDPDAVALMSKQRGAVHEAVAAVEPE